MKTRFMSLIGISALIVLLLAGVLPASAAPAPPDYKPVDIGPKIREWEATRDRIGNIPEDLDEEAALEASEGTPYGECVQDVKIWMSLDDFTGFYIFDTFFLVAATANSELWVQADLSWPAGDPRPTPVVTCEQAAYLLSEFDTNMYPVETSFFGMPDLHDGSYALLEAWGYFPPGYYANAEGKQVVLVSNVRDKNYYDPTFRNYIAGFYSPTFESYFDRNIMSIDAYDWVNRVGPDGLRPYLYESVFAHEYQHLLHDDYDSDEVTWLNEGLSMFSEYLTGYVVNEDAYSTFQETPENSLTAWGDQGDLEIVADYGMVFLYHMYLYEKYGQDFIRYEFLNPDNDITSIESTLAAFNIQTTFADIYHDFSVAVLIDSKQANYQYGFKLLDVGIDIGTADAPNPEAYDTPGAPPWGADYIWLTGKPKDLTGLMFNGVPFTTKPTPWTSDGDMLYSGTGDELDNWAIFESPGGGILSFDTYWDLEDYWDFGFVQVSTDGGYTWTSLADNEGYSTYDYDPNAYPKVIENLPGLTGWSCYDASDPCVINLSYDLSAYAGQNVLIAFRMVTDWSTYYEGWYIDNVYVESNLISDGTDASVFKDITEIVPVDNNFTVTFVGIKSSNKGNQYKVHTMKLDEMVEEGLFEVTKVLSWSNKAVMIVTYDAPEGYNAYADYTYELLFKTKGPRKAKVR